ncbi:MAG TPA: LLM class flavin-dependent oxidoreductase [Chloroflexota bacterium]|nr:LLM class flavin-dependent oxidoreductase [Chloroflexota bacterium]
MDAMQTATRPAPLFGANVDPDLKKRQLAFDLAELADRQALDFIGMQDHPYNGAFLDTWTLLTALGVATRTVRLFTNVANLPLRPPAMLAKAAATLDLLTGGRVELGLGAGAFWEGIAAYGGPRRTPGEAVQALEEGIRVMRLIWGGEDTQAPVSFAGTFYQLHEAQPGPQPAHPIGIWLGALGPRMLELTGRLADGWSISESYVPAERVPEMQQRIDEAAARAGRNSNAIRRNYNLMGMIQPAGQSGMRPRQPGMRFATAGEWVKAIVRFYQELGLDTFIYWPVAGDPQDQTRRFAEEVVPAVREQLGTTAQDSTPAG